MPAQFFDMFEPDRIIGSTINGWIPFPAMFMVIIYLMVASLAVIAYLARRRERSGLAAKSITIMVISTGLLHGTVSDITWARWIAADVRQFWGVPRDEKPAVLDGEVYQFIRQCRIMVKENDYIMYPWTSDDDDLRNYFNRKLEYYLLPARKKTDSGYVIVMYDNNVNFDEREGIFHGYGSEAFKAALLLKHDDNVYLLRRN